MILKKRKVLLIFIGILLLLFYSPFKYFKAHTNIESQNSINKKNINGFTVKNETEVKGISWNEKEINLENDTRFKVNKSSVLNFGIYSRITKEISFERIVNNELIRTDMKAESKIWGLGKLSTKKNNFNKIINDKIDEIFSKT